MERHDGMLAIDRGEPASLRLNEVSYQWPDRRPVFENLTQEIASGERVAIVGGSGSGKSTLAEIIHGLRVPSHGHVTIDDFDPRDLRPDVLRDRVALVTGDEVFQGTIDENVHMQRSGITATDVRDTLHGVGLLESVLELDDGCNSMLSGNGSPLSETQRRLLGIARAAIGSPGLLVVDGTLDALGDIELEKVIEFLTSKDRSWTLIVTTGKSEIARRFDRSIYMDDFAHNRWNKIALSSASGGEQ